MPIRINSPFRLRPVFSSKIIAPNREPAVFGTNSGSADEPLMGGSFFCGERITATFAYVQYASTLCFACAPFLAPKSLRQIWNLRFSERTPEVLTNLSWEVRFFAGNGEGIEALAKPIFVRGVSPFYGSGTAAPFNGWRPCRPKVSVRFFARFYGGTLPLKIHCGQYCGKKCRQR